MSKNKNTLNNNINGKQIGNNYVAQTQYIQINGQENDVEKEKKQESSSKWESILSYIVIGLIILQIAKKTLVLCFVYYIPFILVFSLVLVWMQRKYRAFFVNNIKVMVSIHVLLALISVFSIYIYKSRGGYGLSLLSELNFGLIGCLLIFGSIWIIYKIRSFVLSYIKK